MTPETPPADLVAHAAFVRRLAWRLLGNDAEADDAAQEALARAVERPPRGGPGVGAWLAAVLRNVVRRGKRSEGRRARRERAIARPEVAESGDAAAARGELLRRVTDAVNGLDPRHREVVLLRHYEDLPPREIAARLNVPVETVKGRLKRAHAALRASLDESAGGNVEGWRGALCALVGLDPRGGGVAATAAAGGIAMTTTGKIAVAAAAGALIAIAAWKVLPGEDASPARDLGTTPPALARLDARGSADASLAARPHPAPRPAAAPPADGPAPAPVADAEVSGLLVEQLNALVSPRDTVEGVLLGAASLDGVTVRLEPDPERGRSLLAAGGWPRDAVPARDGSFRFTELAIGTFQLTVLGPGTARRMWSLIVPQVPQGTHRQVVVFGRASVFGRAYDRDGAPLRGSTVLLKPDDWHAFGVAAWAHSVTDAEGAYRIDALRAGGYQVSVSLGGPAGAEDGRTASVTLATGEERRLDLGEDRPEPTWSGIATNASGAPLRPPAVLFLLGTTPRGGARTVRVDEEGRFSARLARGAYEVSVWYQNHVGPPPGKAHLWRLPLTIGDADLARDLSVPGVRVRGVVRDEATGAPFPFGALPRPTVRVLAADDPDSGQEAWHVYVAQDGTFALEGIPPGRWRLSLSPPVGFKAVASGVVTDVPADRDVGGLVLEIRRE